VSRLPALLAAVVALTGCRTQLRYGTPLPVDDTFARVPATGAELERYQAAADWSEAHGGRSLLVLRGPDVLFERYAAGNDAATPHHLFSGTKSFSCALAQSLVAEGLLELDEPVANTLPELAGDPRSASVTVDQLLHLVGGVPGGKLALTIQAMKENPRVQDQYAESLAAEWTDEPGQAFHYGPNAYNLFGALVQRKTGDDPLVWLQGHVLDPIGLRTAGWARDPAGNPMLAQGAWTTPNEWLKYGVLARDDGQWRGQQVLPPGAFAECAQGSAANPAYGLTFWLNHDVDRDTVDLAMFDTLADSGPIFGVGVPSDAFSAAGYHDNRLYILPSLDLVIARQADGDRRFKDDELLALILGL